MNGLDNAILRALAQGSADVADLQCRAYADLDYGKSASPDRVTEELALLEKAGKIKCYGDRWRLFFVKEFDLAKDERIRIEDRDGYSIEGTVLTANFWGENDGWYIELTKDLATEKNRPGRLSQTSYGYFKQSRDGGKVTKL